MILINKLNKCVCSNYSSYSNDEMIKIVNSKKKKGKMAQQFYKKNNNNDT